MRHAPIDAVVRAPLLKDVRWDRAAILAVLLTAWTVFIQSVV